MSNDCTGGPDRCDRQVRMDEQSPGHRGTHTMQASNKSKKSKGPSQPRRGNQQPSAGRKGGAKPSKNGPQYSQRVVGAAKFSRVSNIGMADLVAHRISWIAGYTYVGDGTTGATDSVYFRPVGGSIVPGNTGSGMVPILAADTNVGQAYVADIEKHFTRKRIRSTKVRLTSLNPSTANAMVAWIAPVRGPGASGDTVLVSNTTAAPALASVMGMSGALPVPSWESATLDLSPYIAGGTGTNQCEFNISRDGDDVSTVWGAGGMDLDLIAPCAFVVSGTSATAALRGTNVHAVIVDQVVDFLDFIGGMSLSVPLSFSLKGLSSYLRKSGMKVSDCDVERCYEHLVKASSEKGVCKTSL